MVTAATLVKNVLISWFTGERLTLNRERHDSTISITWHHFVPLRLLVCPFWQTAFCRDEKEARRRVKRNADWSAPRTRSEARSPETWQTITNLRIEIFEAVHPLFYWNVNFQTSILRFAARPRHISTVGTVYRKIKALSLSHFHSVCP